MSNRRPRPPAETVRALETSSKRINQLASELSRRITLFENWLNRLPGRVETEYWAPSHGASNDHLGFLFHRAGKRWILSYDTYLNGIDDPDDEDWHPLTEAPVDIKLEAVRLFPDFLEKMAETQVALARKLEAAQGDFDDFAAAIGASIEDGGA